MRDVARTAGGESPVSGGPSNVKNEGELSIASGSALASTEKGTKATASDSEAAAAGSLDNEDEEERRKRLARMARGGGPLTSSTGEKVAAPAAAAAEETPEILFNRFLKSVPKLTPEQKLQFQAKLHAAGWTEAQQLWRERAPMRRAATPEDVAGLVADLVASDYLTGEVVVLDGGLNLL